MESLIKKEKTVVIKSIPATLVVGILFKMLTDTFYLDYKHYGVEVDLWKRLVCSDF